MPADIAIIGIAAELPSGEYADKNLNHESFFKFLLDKGQAYGQIPSDRINIESWYGRGPGRINVKHGTFLKDIDVFDNVEFGISTKDAQAMSPSTRKLIELAFLSLLDAGIPYRSRNIGCYAAGTNFDILSVTEPDEFDPQGSFAGIPSMVANRVSYHLDLRGPSIPVDTACSSSLTALHLAVQALLQDECEAAVVAGCQIDHRFIDWVMYSQGSVLAKDGKCKPFDMSADGFSRGEGAVSIVIKPLAAALKDDDHIYATILGTAVNSTGSAGPPNAPIAASQLTAMERAFKVAGRNPRDVDYVECHATGTAKGDPEEANWVGEKFCRSDDLYIGSVKGNIGHTEITAFLASLSKVISTLRQKVIPPNVNLTKLNPAIKWDEYKLRVPLEATPLTSRSGDKSLVALASSGIGGANGHVVLESPPETGAHITRSRETPVLLIASGLSNRTTQSISQSIVDVISRNVDELADISIELGRRSRQMSWRSFAVVDPRSNGPPKFTAPALKPRERRPIVFVFSGQGPQYGDMGRQLFGTFSAFRKSILECDDTYRRVTGKSLLDDYGLFKVDGVLSKGISEPWPISLVLPAIAVYQIALFDLLVALGIKPDIVVGHSAGETAVLYASGAGTKSLAVEIAIARGEIMTDIESIGGTMAALSCSAEQTNRFISDALQVYPNSPVELACYNATSASAISGRVDAIDHVIQLAFNEEIFARKIRTKVPFHSSLLESCKDRYQAKMTQIFNRYGGTHFPSVATYSTLTGEKLLTSFDAEYFWSNTRSPVLFQQAISSITHLEPTSMFVEIAPHPVLSPYVATMVESVDMVLPAAKRAKDVDKLTELRVLLKTIGSLVLAGYDTVNFSLLNGGKKFLVYPDSSGHEKQLIMRNGPINFKYLAVNKETYPLMAQHFVGGEPIMPAAAFLEMAFEFGATFLLNVSFKTFLSLSSDRPLRVDIQLNGSLWTVESYRFNASDRELKGKSSELQTKVLHVDGYLSYESIPLSESPLDLECIRNRCKLVADSKTFYENLTEHLVYGSAFRRVSKVTYSTDEALAIIVGLDEDLTSDGEYILHPAILDASFHVCLFRQFTGDHDRSSYYLPSGVGAVFLHQKPKVHYFPNRVYAHCTFKKWTKDTVLYDITLADHEGIRLCTLESFEVSKHHIHPYRDGSGPLQLGYETVVSKEEPDGYSINTANPIFIEFLMGSEIRIRDVLQSTPENSTLYSDIWIVATEGDDGDAAVGFYRALCREMYSRKFRLAIFPDSYDGIKRRNVLEHLPEKLSDEPELYITADGEFRVPRMVSLPDATVGNSKPFIGPYMQPLKDQAVVRVVGLSQQDAVFAFVGNVLACGEERLSKGVIVTGFLLEQPLSEKVLVDISGLNIVEDDKLQDYIPSLLGGFVVGVLAMSSRIFKQLPIVKSQRILVTHYESSIGLGVSQLYSFLGLNIVKLPGDVSLLELSRLRHDPFDVIVSGYDDDLFVEATKALLRSSKSIAYFWNNKERGLAATIFKSPWVISDVSQSLLSLGWDKYRSIKEIRSVLALSSQSSLRTGVHFDPNKTYLVLGGIGSLGAHVALWLYENGARNVVLTSRSGSNGLLKSGNVLPWRIISYLKSCDGLHIRLEKSDATNNEDMSSLLRSISPKLAGCFILTASSMDKSFPLLSEQDFAHSYASKVGVFHNLRHLTDVNGLDFLVVFSSISAVIGNAGQTTYCSAITALDSAASKYSNVLCFVCPPIVGTAMMWDSKANKISFSTNHLQDWSMSGEEMLSWLEDALSRLQTGQKLPSYIPNMDWDKVNQNIPLPKHSQHLLSTKSVASEENTDDSQDVLIKTVMRFLDVTEEEFSPEVAFVSYGLDSISASNLSFALRSIIRLSQTQLLSPQMNFQFLESRVKASSRLSDNPRGTDLDSSDVTKMRSIVTDFQATMHSWKHKPPNGVAVGSSGDVILLTGSTGALGSHILHHLIRSSEVTLVYVLYISSRIIGDIQEHQSASFRNQGLSEELAKSNKVVYVEYSLTEPSLGIKNDYLEEILSSVTHIIHNAWLVDFYAPYTAFGELVQGTRALIELALRPRIVGYPRFVFISTFNVGRIEFEGVQGVDEFSGDVSFIKASGYLKSKWVAEQLLQAARTEAGLPATVIRVGQLSGSLNGAWNTAQWVPAMVKSALYLGCLPSRDDSIDWLPVHTAAQAIVELRQAQDGVVLVSHPKPCRWNSIMKAIADSLNVELVPYHQWFELLDGNRLVPGAPALAGDNPALKLLDLFREFLKSPNLSKTVDSPADTSSIQHSGSLEQASALNSSATLRDKELPQLTAEDAELWLQYWRSIGFL